MRTSLLNTLIAASLLAVGLTGVTPGSLKAEEKPTPTEGAEKKKKPEPKKDDAKKDDKPAAKAAKAFTLPDLDGKKHSLADYKGKIVVIEWINHGCPFVKKHYDAGNMQALQKKYTDKGVVWLSICSSAPGKQGHFSAEDWKKHQEAKKAVPTAVLLDPDGKVGRAYGAVVTPHMWVVDAKGAIAYQGAIDDNRKARGEAIKTAKNYVSQVVDALLDGKKPGVTKTKPYG